MKTKTKFFQNTGKLVSYSALASTFLALGSTAEAQIFYTDMTDEILDENGEIFSLDVNGDLINDLQIHKVFFSFSTTNLYTVGGGSAPGIMQMNHIYATPLNANSIAGSPSPYSFSGYPYALRCSSVIDAGRQWLNSESEIVAYSLLYKFDAGGSSQILNDGNWFGGDTLDRYLGVKLDVGGAKKYGWVRMAVSADNKSVTIKDFAFNNTSDLAIFAGAPNVSPENCDTSLIAVEQIEEADNISAYSFNNSIFISDLQGNYANADIYIADMTGRIVYRGNLSQPQTNIILSNNSTGIYILQVSGNAAVFTKQLFITSVK